MDYMRKYQEWCENKYINKETKEELKSIEGNEEEIKDRFYKELEFGTAGLRGVIGAGTNRMNIYTVTKATQGLANFIIKEKGEEKGVAIAYDSRKMSPEFSEMAALCLNANGIKTYIFDSLRPTPELSFAVRELGCIAGIVVTASHNPPEYNGYKVYWEDGAQIVAPKDKLIIKEVKSVRDLAEVKLMDKKEAVEKGLFNVIGEEIDDKYIEELKKQIINKNVIKKVQKDMKIVYTPLHGTGNILVKRILKELGFENIYVVPEQELPDSNFSTVEYPNPEDPKAFELALKLAEEVDADLVLATDPDADRLGVYAKDSKTNKYNAFTGNMTGVLIAEYLFSQKEANKNLPLNGVLIKTIVSTNMAEKIAELYHVEVMEVLTGFKYIGEKIKLFEEEGEKEFLFGFEESYGCLIGKHARDKDAIVAVMTLCEAAAFYKEHGITLWDQMMRIYEKYGYYKEDVLSITMKGADGAEAIKEILSNLRLNPPMQLGEFKVENIRDYDLGKTKNVKTGKETKLELPKSNVLYYELDDYAWCCVRPSGTEPKIKFYLGVKGENLEDAQNKLDNLKVDIKKKIGIQD